MLLLLSKNKFLILILISFFIVCISGDAKTVITTFEEYEEEVQKLDLVLLFIVPIAIILIGGIYYFIKNRKKVRQLRLK